MKNLLVLILVVAGLASCTTTKKSKSETHLKTDSSAVVVDKSRFDLSHDSVGLKTFKTYSEALRRDEYRIITLDDDTTTSSVDYFTLRDNLVPELKGTTYRPKRIRIETGVRASQEKTTSAATDSARVVNSSSAQLDKKSEIKVATTKTTKTKDLKRTGASVPVYVGIGLLMIIGGIYIYYHYYLKKSIPFIG